MLECFVYFSFMNNCSQLTLLKDMTIMGERHTQVTKLIIMVAMAMLDMVRLKSISIQC